MIRLDELKTLPDMKRLRQGVVVAVIIWLLAILAFSSAISAIRENKDRLNDAERVLRVAVILRGYPGQTDAAGKEPLTAISDITDKNGLKSRVSQLTSSQGGLVLQVNRLYHYELSGLIEEIQKNGLYVKTAELRAVSSQKDGRLINATLTIEGSEQ